MNQKQKISIIIINYNTAQLTLKCIDSIIKNVHSVDYEIIVVDNASIDNSIELIKEACPSIMLIESSTNVGFGKANNLGAKHANGQFLFLLNPDTEIINDPFQDIFSFLISHSDEQIGVIGTFLVDEKGNYSKSGGKFYSAKKYLKLGFYSYFNIPSKPEVDDKLDVVSIDYVIGADMFIRKDLYDMMNGFDEKIFMYFEDVELCKRIFDAGYISYLLKAGKIIHLSKSSGPSQFARIHNMASLMYCLQKEMSRFCFFLFQLLYFTIKFPVVFTKNHKLTENIQYITVVFKFKNYLNK